MKSKNKKKLQNELVKPMVDMLENIAGGLLKAMETKNGPIPVPDNGEMQKYEVNTEPDTTPRCKFSGDYTKVLEILPFKEEDIHEDDVKLIQDFIKLNDTKATKDETKNYFLKLIDNRSIGEMNTPKVDEIVRGFPKIMKSIMSDLDKDDYHTDFEEERIKGLEKRTKKLNKKVKVLSKLMNLYLIK